MSAKRKINPEIHPTLSETLRESSTFLADMSPDRGWAKWPDSFIPVLMAICRDLPQHGLIECIWRFTVGKKGKTGKFDPWSPWWTWNELAETLRCCVEQVKDDAQDAQQRGLLKLEQKWGEVRFQLLWTAWPEIAPYEAKPKPVAEVPKRVTVPGARAVSVAPGASYRYSVEEPVKGLDIANIDLEGFAFKAARADDGWLSLAVVRTGKSEPHSQITKGETKPKGSINKDLESPISKPTPTFQIPSVIVEAVARFGPVTDDALLRMVAECRAVAPGCTEQEIAAVVGQIGDSANGKGNVRSRTGLILKQTPRFFASEMYRAHGVPVVEDNPTAAANRRLLEKARAAGRREQWAQEQVRKLDARLKQKQ